MVFKSNNKLFIFEKRSMQIKSISQWENASIQTICEKIVNASLDKSLKYKVVKVCWEIFSLINEKNKRAEFFLKCENLGFISDRFIWVFENYSHESHEHFIQSILKSDEVMLNAVKTFESQRQMQ